MVFSHVRLPTVAIVESSRTILFATPADLRYPHGCVLRDGFTPLTSPKDTICMLCTTDCFPCSTRQCLGRTCPGQNGLCKGCFGATAASTAKARSSHFIPCGNVIMGCKAMLSSCAAAKSPVCSTCLRLGTPCASLSKGCKNRVADKSQSLCAVCWPPAKTLAWLQESGQFFQKMLVNLATLL